MTQFFDVSKTMNKQLFCNILLRINFINRRKIRIKF